MEDPGDEYPQDLWTMLPFSLQYRVTYWLRTCTPQETEEVTATVDCCIMEAVQVVTGVNFDTKDMPKERLRLPERMKGGGLRRAMDRRYPAFLGALLDVLPRIIDRKAENGEIEVGCYSSQMTRVIGEGAYDADGHRNTMFLEATEVGPYPESMQRAWTTLREEATINYGIEGEEGSEDWARMGPLAETTPATVRNRGATERRGRRRAHEETTENA
jgi:hypothetical protein